MVARYPMRRIRCTVVEVKHKGGPKRVYVRPDPDEVWELNYGQAVERVDDLHPPQT